jgi:hypothetical protein
MLNGDNCDRQTEKLETAQSPPCDRFRGQAV